MIYKPMILALLLFIPGLVAGAEKVTPYFPAEEISFNFNKPISEDIFPVEETLILRNKDNASSAEFQDLRVSIKGVDGIKEEVSTSYSKFKVPPDTNVKVTLTFYAKSTMAEGRYSNGTLEIVGTGVNTKKIPITIDIRHPPPTINATWNSVDLGDVKAGSKLSYILTVQEVMGYKPAEGIAIKIYGLGPVENLTYVDTLGDFEPLGFRDVEVNFSIRKRNLRPGTYSIVPIITSSSTINANVKDLRYTIPVPQMQIKPGKIDFDKITFETGKDTKTVTLNISETGGYTPIEGLSVSLLNGAKGWVTHSKRDYIPAGKSIKYHFRIFLPPDASLGLKSWDFKLKTLYAGSKDIHAAVIVSFPGTDEAIKSLKNAGSVTGLKGEDELIRNTITLLEASKGKTQLRKIAMVMSVYGGTRTFLSNLETAGNSADLVVAGDAVIRAKAALNKMQIGNQNLKDAELKIHSSKVVSSAKKIWNSKSADMLITLKKSAEDNKDSNYKLTAFYYNRISKIYMLLGDPSNTKKYLEKQRDIEKRYQNALLEAGTLNRAADNRLESVRKQTFILGEDTYLVLNPFSYDSVSRNYEEAIQEYEEAAAIYRMAGEDSDADLLESELEEIIRQKDNLFRTFVAYGSVLGLIFLWFIGRVVWGLQHYIQDEMDGHYGDVITGGEAEAVGGFKTWPAVMGDAIKGKKNKL